MSGNQRLAAQYPNTHMYREESDSSEDSPASTVSSSYLSQTSTRVGVATQSSYRAGATQPGRMPMQSQSSLRMPALAGRREETPPNQGSFRSGPPAPAPGRGGTYPKGTCDKCDGAHLTDMYASLPGRMLPLHWNVRGLRKVCGSETVWM